MPEELLRRGGIGSRARARLAESSVLIEGTEDVPRPEPEAPKRAPAAPTGGVAIELRDLVKRRASEPSSPA